MKKVELLAPAGSFESLKAAINAGADAVYIGGKSFGARAFADNPDNDLLIKGIEYCHLHNKKLYLTVNTLLKNKELECGLFEFIRPLYLAGIDAVIVQDEGVMNFLSRVFPNLPIHLSTQASIVCAQGADYFKKRYTSVERVVPARELSLAELISFKKESSLELEVFIHGALCYCYSGQCLLSSMIGCRSGNRGRCAQPCRKLYSGKYLLSPKDLCTISDFDKLLDIGIDSFKIEGRMKSPEYTAGVVSVYRELIDKYYEVREKGESFASFRENNRDYFQTRTDILRELFNRGGFTNGYLEQHNSPDMMSFERPNHSGVLVGEVINVKGREAIIKLSTDVERHDVLEIRNFSGKCLFEYTIGNSFKSNEIISVLTMKGIRAGKGMEVYRTRNNSLLSTIEERYVINDKKLSVNVDIHACLGKKLSCRFILSDSTEYIAYGSEVQPAMKQPTTAADIEKQIRKLGNTAFVCDSINIDSSENIFISVSELNNLRREACEGLYGKKIGAGQRAEDSISIEALIKFKKQYFENESELPEGFCYTASCRTLEQLHSCISSNLFKRIYYNISSFDTRDIDLAILAAADTSVKLYIGLPYICRYEIIDKVYKLMMDYKDKVAFLIRNREELSLALELKTDFRIDYNVYASNNASIDDDCGNRTLCTELTASELCELKAMDRELIVFGYQPVMFSAQCVFKNLYGHCLDKSFTEAVEITDELGHSFKTLQMCGFCYNVIFNSACHNITNETELLEKVSPSALRYDFVFETGDEITNSLSNMPDCFKAPSDRSYTNGHFKRTVD